MQLGSQQRSEYQLRYAWQLVRNGRIVPSNLDYDEWLGSTPQVYYTEKRVHPQLQNLQARYHRPGWLRCEQFGVGMITGWGAHHVDTAHVAMDTEETGPLEVTATAEFPKKGLWDVHGKYHVRARYANGVAVYISEMYPNGLPSIGEDGWIWVTRGSYKPGDWAEGKPRSRVLDASDPRILCGISA